MSGEVQDEPAVAPEDAPKSAASWNTVLVDDKRSIEENMDYYSTWESYDDDLTACGYNGPAMVQEAVGKLGLPKNVKVLDILAGTGMVAKRLRALGYTDIDALDGNMAMLERGIKNGYFEAVYCAFVTPEGIDGVPEGMYDLQTSSGGFVPGHIGSACIPVLVKLVKIGGYCVWARRAEYSQVDSLRDFNDVLDRLIQEGVIEEIRRDVLPNYCFDKDGAVHVFKRLK